MENLEKILKLYNYNLPKELIAQEPASPRDNSRLLVYNKKEKKITFDKFYNLHKYIPQNAVLVFNETKVLPARLELKKETGGMVKILYLGQKNNLIEVLADRKLEVGAKLFLFAMRSFSKVGNNKEIFKVVGKNDKSYFLKFTDKKKDIYEILQKYGKTPIPPYIKNSQLSEKQLKEKYQTIFAKQLGSVAAPTASLHFTKRVFTKLKKKGVDIKFVNLNVGLGTFAPLTEDNLKTKKLHKEFYSINKDTSYFLNKAKKQSRPIIGVGTTVVRTLESAARGNKLMKLSGQTQLFIEENYKFQFIDGMITNFHVPKSSLLMLVSALVSRKELLNIYNKAIEQKFRFFSFGDGMLIL